MAQRLPSLNSKQVIRALERAGFYQRRQTGSHLILRKEGLERPTPVPIHSGDIPRKLVLQIIKEAGLTVEEFLELL
ncbi:MAG: type II toxin-antitoxin system HicA family toxin [Chloroflexi bacterium]|nr:type II toxin-antitoxin system HicA family toxin [Chloroflexota bacterium]